MKHSESEPPRWGEYQNARAYYQSDEWLDIVRASLDSHRVCLLSAQRIGNHEAIKFYAFQIKTCEQALGLVPTAKTQTLTTTQQSLFDSLLKR